LFTPDCQERKEREPSDCCACLNLLAFACASSYETSEMLTIVAEPMVIRALKSGIHPLDGSGLIRDYSQNRPSTSSLEPINSKVWRRHVDHHRVNSINFWVLNPIANIQNAVMVHALVAGGLFEEVETIRSSLKWH